MPDPSGTPPAPAPVAITSESLSAVQGDQFRSLLPADIQSKPYAKDINTFGDLVKKFDGAQTLLGQRVLPDKDTPPEKWAEFHAKFRPESADKYDLGQVEGLDSEYLKKSDGIVKILKNVLYNGGASAFQAKTIIPSILKELATAETLLTKQQDEKFAKLSTDLFGTQKDAVLSNGKKFLAAHLPDNVKPLLEGLDEKQLTVVLAATDSLAKKFTGEDPFRGSGAGSGGTGGESKDQLIAQMQEIQKDPAYVDPFKDRVKHTALKTKMEEIRGKLRKIMPS